MVKNISLTKDSFKKRLKDIHMTQVEFAKKIGYSEIAVKKWKDGNIPSWVEYVLKYFELAAEANKQLKDTNFN